MKKKSKSHLKGIVDVGVTNLVGIGMIGATSEMVNALPTGTAKTITGIVPGLQSTALLGPNLKLVSKSFKSKKEKSFW